MKCPPPNHKQWYHAGPFAQENKRLMPYALHFPLNTTLPASKHLKCLPNFISVEGHTDWITVTVLMCELGVSVTGCSGHHDLNENQTTLLYYKEPNAEVIVTLCDSLQNHLHSKTIPHWVQHWLFSTHQVEHNQPSVLHTSSIPSLGMLCSLPGRKGTGSLSLL